jgi:hypothetical protein
MMPLWTAAPIATISSGLTFFDGGLPKIAHRPLLHRRHAGHAAHQQDLVDVLGATVRQPPAPPGTAR